MTRRHYDQSSDAISTSSDNEDSDAPSSPGPSNHRVRVLPLHAQGSAALDVPHALDDASRTQLHIAIATSPEEHVREAFATLVDSIPAVTERVFGMLVAVPAGGRNGPAVVPRPIERPVPVPRLLHAPAHAPAYRAPAPIYHTHMPRQHPHQRAAMASRWVTCTNCDEEYDVGAERDPEECRYHTGDLEVDEEAFVDWDEDVHGPMDTRSNRKEFPENFTWSCCDRDGTQAGCVFAVHEPEEGHGPRKRARRH
ncbi:hypothetical protein C8Q78DRAFT_972915 [Trametes maxima]|nr:hypothetical protein C8Q78DRAFT_972915 [Trametes maxima]